eukprot:TRINITY_DN48433_c0_g1_i1.p1 TRINITY_DN48433_c0_g1~~TRINITY_DN48433_c0_g1_i1.p1  ORF type:complete len:1198 (-),score=180.61 TRINITY_DN48433_c0_g1_i1:1000-4365(-)
MQAAKSASAATRNEIGLPSDPHNKSTQDGHTAGGIPQEDIGLFSNSRTYVPDCASAPTGDETTSSGTLDGSTPSPAAESASAPTGCGAASSGTLDGSTPSRADESASARGESATESRSATLGGIDLGSCGGGGVFMGLAGAQSHGGTTQLDAAARSDGSVADCTRQPMSGAQESADSARGVDATQRAPEHLLAFLYNRACLCKKMKKLFLLHPAANAVRCVDLSADSPHVCTVRHGALNQPYSITVDEDTHSLWVADKSPERVHCVDLKTGLTQPVQGLASTDTESGIELQLHYFDGYLYAANSVGEVNRVNTETGDVEEFSLETESDDFDPDNALKGNPKFSFFGWAKKLFKRESRGFETVEPSTDNNMAELTEKEHLPDTHTEITRERELRKSILDCVDGTVANPWVWKVFCKVKEGVREELLQDKTLRMEAIYTLMEQQETMDRARDALLMESKKMRDAAVQDLTPDHAELRCEALDALKEADDVRTEAIDALMEDSGLRDDAVRALLEDPEFQENALDTLCKDEDMQAEAMDQLREDNRFREQFATKLRDDEEFMAEMKDDLREDANFMAELIRDVLDEDPDLLEDLILDSTEVRDVVADTVLQNSMFIKQLEKDDELMAKVVNAMSESEAVMAKVEAQCQQDPEFLIRIADAMKEEMLQYNSFDDLTQRLLQDEAVKEHLGKRVMANPNLIRQYVDLDKIRDSDEVLQMVKQEMKGEQAVWDDLKSELKEDPDVINEVKAELAESEELREEATEQLMTEGRIRCAAIEELKDDPNVRALAAKQLKSNVQLREEVRDSLREDDEFVEELRSELRGDPGLLAELKQELSTDTEIVYAVKEELRNELQQDPQVLKEAQAELVANPDFTEEVRQELMDPNGPLVQKVREDVVMSELYTHPSLWDEALARLMQQEGDALKADLEKAVKDELKRDFAREQGLEAAAVENIMKEIRQDRTRMEQLEEQVRIELKQRMIGDPEKILEEEVQKRVHALVGDDMYAQEYQELQDSVKAKVEAERENIEQTLKAERDAAIVKKHEELLAQATKEIESSEEYKEMTEKAKAQLEAELIEKWRSDTGFVEEIELSVKSQLQREAKERVEEDLHRQKVTREPFKMRLKRH